MVNNIFCMCQVPPHWEQIPIHILYHPAGMSSPCETFNGCWTMESPGLRRCHSPAEVEVTDVSGSDAKGDGRGCLAWGLPMDQREEVCGIWEDARYQVEDLFYRWVESLDAIGMFCKNHPHPGELYF